jgi:hypothetical protein
VAFFTLFALLVLHSLYSHIMWQKKSDGPQGDANAEANGSDIKCGATEFFLVVDPKTCCQKVFGRSRHIMRQKRRGHAGKTLTFAHVFAW